MLTITRRSGTTILKNGKKKFGEVTYNANPDYKWVLWLEGGGALSGYETQQAAIDRAQKMHSDWIQTLIDTTK